jgi:hypothetical protein
MIITSIFLAIRYKKVKQEINIYVNSPELMHTNPLHHQQMNELRV